MFRVVLALAASLLPLAGRAQANAGWEACAAMADAPQRLACFDRWAESQKAPVHGPAPRPVQAIAPPLTPATPVGPAAMRLTVEEGCHDERYSGLSRFWELERGSDCGVFGLRSLRPMTASAVFANTVNRQPASENPANNAANPIDYRTREMRLQLSVRSKLAQNLLVRPATGLSDSLWFAYSQQSYWQLFTPSISRPFRSTDHEPELMYIHPLTASAAGWDLRYAGLSIVHHSNGQSLPYSRSWNRAVLMAGAERGPLQLQARLWRRIPESPEKDDNPGISDFYGRAELQAKWRPHPDHMFTATARHSLDRASRGSLRLEWFRTLWDDSDRPAGGLQLHTQLFTGYGDTLLDYNRRRTVFTIGLSLAEW